MFKKVISFVLSVIFSLQTCGLAQAAQFSLAGYLGQGGGAPALDRFRPAHLRYFSYEPDSDNFRILLDKADEKDLSDVQVKDKADELMRYFRIGLSLPNDKFWVNLRPDAPEQIIDPELERTDIGKIMLEADLQLKKDTASLTSPQTKEGKEYWDKLYKKAGELFGTENITIPTITRPWIVPGEIIVRQSGNSAYIYKAALKVMLEEDYLKSSQLSAVSSQQYNFTDPRLKELNQYSTQLIRELIIPKLTKEVNRSKRYAGLRQVYYSLILARWFKQSYQNSGASVHEKNTLTKLIDSSNLSNLTSQEPWSKDTYYQGYKKSFEQGEYNLSQTVHTPTGQLIRMYVSGGISAGSALTVDDRFDIGKVNNGIPGVGDKGILFNYTSSGSKPVVRAAASALTLAEAQRQFNNMLYFSQEPSWRDMNNEVLSLIYDDTQDFYSLYESINKISTESKYWLFTQGIEIKKKIEELLIAVKIQHFYQLFRRKDFDKEEILSFIKESTGNQYKDSIDFRSVVYSVTKDFIFEDESNDKHKKKLKVEVYKSKNNEIEFCNVKLFSEDTIFGNFGNSFLDMEFNISVQDQMLLKGEESLIKMSINEISNLVDSLEKALGVSGASSALTLPEAKDVIIDITSRIEFDNTYSLAYKEKSYPEHIKAGKDFEVLYNELDSLLQNEKNVKKDTKEELMRVQNSLKPGIFADALNKFEVTVERIKQPKFKHYKDPYPRFVIHLGGIELNLILRIHNADIKNKAYAYGLNVYEVIKNGLGGDLYFSSEVSSKGGVIVTYMSEKMLELKPKDLNILAEKIGEILGDSSVSSALTPKERMTEELNKDVVLNEEKLKLQIAMGSRIDKSNEKLKKSLGERIGKDVLANIEEKVRVVSKVFVSITDLRILGISSMSQDFELIAVPMEGVDLSIKYRIFLWDDSRGVILDFSIGEKISVSYASESFFKYYSDHGWSDLGTRIKDALGISGASSAVATKGAAPEDIGAVDFRAMDMLIQPQGSFRGLDFSPVRLSSSALEAMDLDKSLEGIKQMVSGSMRPAPQRLKEYISACIFKGKIDEKADDFILSMLDVFQLQAEEGIESAALEREAVVLADTRRYVLPEKRLAASNGYSLN